MYADDDLLLISGLQHLTFCERQWVLIHVEQLWAENFLTVEGGHLHENVHQIGSESRGEVKLATGLYLRSSKLGLYGVADMVEFHRDDERGVVIPGFKDKTKKWLPYPIEYKRGRKRWDNADEIQMCAQAICLEEMLGCSVPEGAIFYGEPKRRVKVALTERFAAKSLINAIERGYWPLAVTGLSTIMENNVKIVLCANIVCLKRRAYRPDR